MILALPLHKRKVNRLGFHMALQLIGRSSLPVTTRGKEGTFSVAVRENGQIGFSTKAAKVFDNVTACTIGWDPDKRVMIFSPVDVKKLPKGIKQEDTFIVGQAKNGSRYISAAGLFKLDGIEYDYKAAGTHSFEAKEENGKLSFELPESMKPKVRTPRKPKAANANAGAGAGAGESATELKEA